MVRDQSLDFQPAIRHYRDGVLHREDGPAVEYSNGTMVWYIGGKKHRTDGPAIEYSSGKKCWCHNGEFHRLDGPAIERPDGRMDWYYFGKRFQISDVIGYEPKLPLTEEEQFVIILSNS